MSEKATLRLKVTNVLNRPVAGTFAANETRVLEVLVSGLKEATDNRYAQEVNFVGENGKSERGIIKDTLHVNYIARRRVKIDGDLADRCDVLPQVVEGSGIAKQTVTEAVWLPMVPYKAGQDGGLPKWRFRGRNCRM